MALKVAPANREAHRVLGIVYATLVESGRRGNARSQTAQAENLNKAIQHLEQALDRPSGEPLRVDAGADLCVALTSDLEQKLVRWLVTTKSERRGIPIDSAA